MRKTTKKIASLVLAGAMVVTSAPVTSEAATATVKLNKSSAKVTVGKTVTLKVSKKNVSSKNKVTKITSKTWKSKKPSIATVSGGKVKGVKAGTTKITCKVTYTIKKNKKTTSKTKTLSCNVTVNAKKVTPTATPVSTATAPSSTATAPASTATAPASGAPASSDTPASGTPASGAPSSSAAPSSSGTPASQTPSASASAAPSASASAAPSASASAAPSASASAAPAIATAAPASATTTPTPTPVTALYSGTQFKYDQTKNLDGDPTATTIRFKGLSVVDATDSTPSSKSVEIRISKVGDTSKEASGDYGWKAADNDGKASFENLEADTTYTFAARVAATDEHGAGVESTFEVKTIGTRINVSGLKFKGTDPVAYGTTYVKNDHAESIVNTENVTWSYASSGETGTIISPSWAFTFAKAYTGGTALKKNTNVELDVVLTGTVGGKNVTYNGKATVLVPVKAKTPEVKLAYATGNNGYIKITSINDGIDLPSRLQYTMGTGDNTVWTDVNSNLTIKSGSVTDADVTNLNNIRFKIADSTSPAKDAADGWSESTEATKDNGVTIVDGGDFNAIVNGGNASTDTYEVSDKRVTLKSGTFTLSESITSFEKELVINKDAVLDIVDSGSLQFAAEAKVTNNGKIQVTGTGAITNNGIITNNGTLDNQGSVTNNGTIEGTGAQKYKVGSATYTITGAKQVGLYATDIKLATQSSQTADGLNALIADAKGEAYSTITSDWMNDVAYAVFKGLETSSYYYLVQTVGSSEELSGFSTMSDGTVASAWVEHGKTWSGMLWYKANIQKTGNNDVSKFTLYVSEDDLTTALGQQLEDADNSGNTYYHAKVAKDETPAKTPSKVLESLGAKVAFDISAGA